MDWKLRASGFTGEISGMIVDTYKVCTLFIIEVQVNGTAYRTREAETGFWKHHSQESGKNCSLVEINSLEWSQRFKKN